MRIQNLDTGNTITFSSSNGISFGSAGDTITASVPGATATGNLGGVAVNASTSFTSGTIVFSDSNGISWGVNGNTITASVVAGGAGGLDGLAVDAATTYTGTVLFSNANGVSFGANVSTITASVDGPVALVAGTQTATSGTVVFSNSNAISFGMAGSATVTAAWNSLRFYRGKYDPDFPALVGVPEMECQRILISNSIRATQCDLLGSFSHGAGGTGFWFIKVGLYGLTGSTANFLSSAQLSTTFAASNSTNFTGQQWIPISIGTWSITPGEYLFAHQVTTNNGQDNWQFGALSAIGAITVNNGSTNVYFADGSPVNQAWTTSFVLSDYSQVGIYAQQQPFFRLIGSF